MAIEQKLPHLVRQAQFAKDALDAGALQVFHRIAQIIGEVRDHALALRGAAYVPFGQFAGFVCQTRLEPLHGAQSSRGKLSINGHASVVDPLVNVPQFKLVTAAVGCWTGVVPLRQALVDLAHRLDVHARIRFKRFPVGRVRRAITDAKLAVGGLRLAEQEDQPLAVFVLRQIGRHVQHRAELVQRAGEAVGQRLHHRVVDLLHREVDPDVTQDSAVERGVMDDDYSRLVYQVLQVVQRRGAVGHVHADGGLVVPSVGRQNDLGTLRVSVGAVGNGNFAKGLAVKE